MEEIKSSSEDLKTIRKIMEESTRFLSLSGFSGIFPGIFAIAGALIAWFLILDKGNAGCSGYTAEFSEKAAFAVKARMALDALAVLFLSVISAFWFSFRRAKQSGNRFWTPVSRRFLISLFIPLITGGFFAMILLFQDHVMLIIPVFLIFYGLALINASKFTYNEIFYLGILEIFTGLICSLFPDRGLIFWIIGFGILHILYGIMMYRKYES